MMEFVLSIYYRLGRQPDVLDSCQPLTYILNHK